MANVTFIDISRWQGDFNMDANGDAAIMMKMSGGDDGLYYDQQAGNNYNKAVRLQKTPMMYHFYGGGDPIVEADFFLKACSPLADHDIMALDIESSQVWNPQTDPLAVAKVAAMASHIHDATGMWPWVYMNMSTANMYDWSPVFNNCGFWCAAPSYGFDAKLPVKYPVIAQQGPIVNGLDTDMFFGSIDDLWKYGYHSSNGTETPAPTPTPQPAVTPGVPDAPAPVSSVPVSEPTPAPDPVPTPAPTESGTSVTPVEDAGWIGPRETTKDPDEPTDDPNRVQVEAWKKIGIRVFHTFWQAFVAAFLAGITGVLSGVLNIHNLSDARSFGLALLVAVGSAVLAAIKNVISKKDELWTS